MPKSSKPKKTYDVGKGKPPKHAQWQPGQSGNPSGKKKRKPVMVPGLAEATRDELLKTVGMNVDGETVQQPLILAFARKLVHMLAGAKSAHEMRHLYATLKDLGVWKLLADDYEQAKLRAHEDAPGYFTEEDRRLIALLTKPEEEPETDEDEECDDTDGPASDPEPEE